MSFEFERIEARRERVHGRETAAALSTAYVSLAELFYPVYAYFAPSSDDFIRPFEQKLKETNFSTTGELYLSASLGIGTIVGTIFGVVVLVVAYTALVLWNVTLPSMPYRMCLPRRDFGNSVSW